MKNAKREMRKQKILALALVGIFSAHCMPAYAAEEAQAPSTWARFLSNLSSDVEIKKTSAPVAVKPAPEQDPDKTTTESTPTLSANRKSGLTMDELQNVVGDLEVVKDGSKVTIAGVIPERCAGTNKEGDGPQVNYVYDKELKQHALTVILPGCEDNYAAAKKGENLVSLSDVLRTVNLKDESGKVVLRYFKAGDKRSKKLKQDTELTDADDKAIVHKGSAELQKEKDKLAKEEADKKKVKSLEDLELKIGKFCDAGDIDAVSTELLAAKNLLGDVSALIEKANLAKKAKLKKALETADSAEKATEALEAYQAAAAEQGWDADELKESFIAKRFELMNASVEAYKSGEKKSREAERELRTWASELRGVDSREFRKRKNEFGVAFAELATAAANKGETDEAVSLYEKAKSFSDVGGDVKLDGQISKVWAEKYKECLKSAGMNVGKCDAYAAKAKNAAASAGKALAAQKGDNSAAEYAAFQQEYAGIFGAGMEMNFSDYGKMTQQPGLLEQTKQAAFREAVQKEMQAQQQKMMQQMMGGMAAMPGAAPSSVLGIK